MSHQSDTVLESTNKIWASLLNIDKLKRARALHDKAERERRNFNARVDRLNRDRRTNSKKFNPKLAASIKKRHAAIDIDRPKVEAAFDEVRALLDEINEVDAGLRQGEET